jgi:hypothetical protein
MMKSFLYQLERNLRGPFDAPYATNDKRLVLLASFPKSGNTWFRFVVSNVNALLMNMEPADFHAITMLAPEIRRNRQLEGAIFVDNSPTFLKTHFPYTRHFGALRSVVMVRNPFLVIPSYHNYLEKARKKTVPPLEQFFWHWRYGFDAWASFMQAWEDNATMIVKYEDMLDNTFASVDKIYKDLGYTIAPEILQKAIDLSSRSSMKESLDKKGDPNNKHGFNFVRGANENKGVMHLKQEILDSGRLSEEFFRQAKKFGYL